LHLLQKLGKNQGGYHGEGIDIRAMLGDLESAAQQHGWAAESIHATDDFKWLALRREPLATVPSRRPPRIYISTGIHGDEPAGPLAALRLLRENRWPANAQIVLLPCLNPTGFALNRRESGQGIDLNRDYLHFESDETRAHVAWWEKQPGFDLCLCLHEDWESHGFYLYEWNLDDRPSLAEPIVAAVGEVCPVDPSEIIEGRPAQHGIIRPSADPRTRPQWPEAFWLLTHKTRLSYTLEAPSDFPLSTRVDALVAGVNAALEKFRDDPRE
jgi:predicted deacylase